MTFKLIFLIINDLKVHRKINCYSQYLLCIFKQLHFVKVVSNALNLNALFAYSEIKIIISRIYSNNGYCY